ncbi:MAG: hypothetical protein KJO88_08860 [Gammaproteobacteria bacterium]|nr:hypothetical protein [Gammaproteobacteria bacterium]
MPIIETQGVSEDYSTATGIFEPIERGNVTKHKLLEILKKVSVLQQPVADNDCPPTVNAMLSEGYYTCFAAADGRIDCTDSQTETMSVSDALSIICGEQSLEEYDALHGYTRIKANKSFGVAFVAAFIAAIAGVVIYKFIT